jgi:uncharacterized protein (TIGR02145 family)
MLRKNIFTKKLSTKIFLLLFTFSIIVAGALLLDNNSSQAQTDVCSGDVCDSYFISASNDKILEAHGDTVRAENTSTESVFIPVKTTLEWNDFLINHPTHIIIYDQVSLIYSSSGSGSISGDTNQMIDSGTSGTTVTAIPDAGNEFTGWSDGVSTASRTDTNVSSDLNVTANFTGSTYTLTYSAGSGGSISGTTTQTVDHGGSGTAVTAVPNTGYHFTGWSDGVGTASRTDTNVTGSINVTASFAINSYTLTYNAGSGGSISGTSPQTVNYGSSGTAVTAVPNTGYSFTGWSDGVGTATRTDTNVTANKTVTANFSINTYTLTYNAGSGGSISGTSPQTVNYGTSGTTVTAIPNTGYHFTGWSDGVSSASRTDTNVTANKTVTANFSINTYILTYNAGSGGSVSGDTSQTVNHGSDGSTVTAVPNTGYSFTGWSDGVGTASRTDTNVTANKTVTANFSINTYTLTYNAGSGGSVSGDTSQTVNHGSDGSTVTAVPNTGYSFTGWSDGVSTASRTDTNVTANKTVTANFSINTYTLTYNAGSGGSISGTSPQTVNYGDSGTTVTAVPNTGYSFTGWSDGVSSASRTDTNVTANKTVTANFSINTYTLTYTAGSGGSISGTSPQTVNYGGSGTTVTAVPNSGYEFTSWSDGVSSASRTDTNVTNDISVVANFSALATYTLTYNAGTGGTIIGDVSQTVVEGGDGTKVEAVANSGYKFVDWTGTYTSTTNPREDINVTNNITLTANFIETTKYTVTYTAGNNGTLVDGDGYSGDKLIYEIYEGSDVISIEAVADSGYVFDQWSQADIFTNPRRDTNVTSDLNIQASFKAVCNGSVVYDGITYNMVESNGQCWLDKNLGAINVCATDYKTDCRGDLYQWGRANDGHQARDSRAEIKLSSVDKPGEPIFYLVKDYPYDWREPNNDSFWQDYDVQNIINNPCPSGWKVPNYSEFETEISTWSSLDISEAFNSPLKLAPVGYRSNNNGSLIDVDTFGHYWCNDINDIYATYFYFGDNLGNTQNSRKGGGFRAMGKSVRCIRY